MPHPKTYTSAAKSARRNPPTAPKYAKQRERHIPTLSETIMADAWPREVPVADFPPNSWPPTSRLGIRITRLLALVAEVEADTAVKTRIADALSGTLPTSGAGLTFSGGTTLPLFDELDAALDRLAAANAEARDATARLANP